VLQNLTEEEKILNTKLEGKNFF